MMPRRYPVIAEAEWRPLLAVAKQARPMGPHRQPPRRHGWQLYADRFTADNPRLTFGERMARWAGLARWGRS